MKIVEPALRLQSFNCPRCGTLAHQHWEELEIRAEAFGTGFAKVPFPFNDSPDPDYVRVRGESLEIADSVLGNSYWVASLCCSCYKFTVWREDKIVFPSNASLVPPPHELMSPEAKSLYEEAAAVLPVSRRAAAALARATMEAEVRVHVGGPRDDLHTLIGKLSDRVSTSLWEALTVLRDTGNKALHGGSEGVVGLLLDESDAELTPFLLSAVNQIVDEVVARPKQANALYNMLPEGVRTSAENKRAKDTGS